MIDAMGLERDIIGELAANAAFERIMLYAASKSTLNLQLYMCGTVR